MNRMEMAEEIAKRVPMLAQRDKDEWKEAEQVRAAFVAGFNRVNFPNHFLANSLFITVWSSGKTPLSQ